MASVSLTVVRSEDPTSRIVTAQVEPPEDWLASIVRQSFHVWFDNVEPPPTTWARIRQAIETVEPSLLEEEDSYHVYK